jgi:hypothetical protein
MKKIIVGVALVASLAGCQVFERMHGPLGAPVIGKPLIVFDEIGALVVNQEPLVVRDMGTVVWSLPDDGATYDRFSFTIGSLVKRATADGKVVRYEPVPPKPVNAAAECRRGEKAQFICRLPAGLERRAVYTYTIKFTRNGQLHELDPLIMPDY